MSRCPRCWRRLAPIRDRRPRRAESRTRRRSSSRSRCCAATSAATARSPSRRPGSRRPTSARTGARASPGRGAAAGCHEALFTLGERPEERYPAARQWLDEHGYASTVDYLVAMCRARARRDRPAPPRQRRRAVPRRAGRAARGRRRRQGMMLESLNPDLDCHRGSPDKTPERRLATLEAAGELAIPFTTGILVGIGETRADRIDGARGHRRVAPPPRPRAGGDRPELPARSPAPRCTPRRRARPTSTSRPSPWPG